MLTRTLVRVETNERDRTEVNSSLIKSRFIVMGSTKIQHKYSRISEANGNKVLPIVSTLILSILLIRSL